MNDLWHIHGAPEWVACAYLYGHLKGLVSQSSEGVLAVCVALHPDLDDFRIVRLLPPQGHFLSYPVRTEEAVFSIDRATHRLTYLRTDA